MHPSKKELLALIAKLNAKIDAKIISGKPYRALARLHRRAVSDLRYAK